MSIVELSYDCPGKDVQLSLSPLHTGYARTPGSDDEDKRGFDTETKDAHLTSTFRISTLRANS